MATVSDYVQYLLIDYMIPKDDIYIYEDLELKLVQQIKELNLIPDYQAAAIAYRELGGGDFLRDEIILKHQLYKYQKSTKVTLIISTIMGPISFVIFVIYSAFLLINAFSGGNYYNEDGSFFGLFEANYVNMLTYYWLIKTIIAFIGSIILLITDSIITPHKNIIISLSIGIITFPFGLVLLIYAVMKFISNFFLFQKQHYIKYAVYGLLSITIFTVFAVGINQTKAHDEFAYGEANAAIYSTYLDAYEVTDHPFITANSGYIHMTYSDQQLYYVSVTDIYIETSEMDAQSNSPIEYTILLNDFAVCENQTSSELTNHEVNCYYTATSLEDVVAFDINYIEVKIVLNYTNESNELITEEIIIVTITNMVENEFHFL